MVSFSLLGHGEVTCCTYLAGIWALGPAISWIFLLDAPIAVTRLLADICRIDAVGGGTVLYMSPLITVEVIKPTYSGLPTLRMFSFFFILALWPAHDDQLGSINAKHS